MFGVYSVDSGPDSLNLLLHVLIQQTCKLKLSGGIQKPQPRSLQRAPAVGSNGFDTVHYFPFSGNAINDERMRSLDFTGTFPGGAKLCRVAVKNAFKLLFNSGYESQSFVWKLPLFPWLRTILLVRGSVGQMAIQAWTGSGVVGPIDVMGHQESPRQGQGDAQDRASWACLGGCWLGWA